MLLVHIVIILSAARATTGCASTTDTTIGCARTTTTTGTIGTITTTDTTAGSNLERVKLDTKLGVVVGTTSNVVQGGLVAHRFLGIPYAKAPVGRLRFTKPQPYGEFNNKSHDGLEFASPCPQYLDNKAVGEEDCLYLNVFVPKATDTTLKSTMIWIHGGSFITGQSEHFPADALAALGDVVVVTINYRLNVFGFLTTGDSRVPGNYGLWDQRLAIEWVKDNIKDYGGNPDSITLFGESAGGRSVSFQMFSPTNTVDLFQRGIVQSGSALSLTYINHNPLPVFSTVIEQVDCLDETKLFNCLQSKPMRQLLRATKTIDKPFPFFPIVDGDFLPNDLSKIFSDLFLTQHQDLTKNIIGDFGTYDFLGGWNLQEGFYMFHFLDEVNQRMNGQDWTNGVSLDTLRQALNNFPFNNYPTDDLTRRTIIELYINYYISNQLDLVSRNRSVEEQYLELYSLISGDIVVKLPVIQLLQLHSTVSPTNTFAYEFQKKRPEATQTSPTPEWLRVGATHGDEIPYVFGYPLWTKDSERELTNGFRCADCKDEDRELSRTMIEYWTTFAKNGDPGQPFEVFTHPQGQLYTILNGSYINQHSYPSQDKTQLWSAVNAALIYADKERSGDVSNAPPKRRYLFGLLILNAHEVDLLLAALLTLIAPLVLALLFLWCRTRKSSPDRRKKDE